MSHFNNASPNSSKFKYPTMHPIKSFFLYLLCLSSAIMSFAQPIPSPKEHFGFNIGDNYKLANYTQTEAYFRKIAAVSSRAKLIDIGKTEEGRSQLMMIITSPENLKNLDKYKSISQKLARAEGLNPEEAKALAAEGKAVVWIDGGLHATEVVGAHQLIEITYQLNSRTDNETKNILDNVIVLVTHANPDGQELVSNWYMRNQDTLKRTTQYLPRLYEKYAGHDNNRDFYMQNLKETQNMSRQLFVEWLPQIMYNHHQTGPPGAVVAGPPFRDPFNYVFDPLVMTSLDAVGAAMINRLNTENKPGFTQRAGSPYSTWYNGGLRTTTYFHNMIGLLTEIIGSPTPSEIPLVPARLIPSSANPFPITPRKWYFKNSIEYSVSLNYGVLSYAMRHRDELLFNIYRMGRNSIQKGQTDTWTSYPKRADEINELNKKEQSAKPAAAASETPESWGRNTQAIPLKLYDSVFKNPTYRDARAYIIPSDQADFATATRFVNALIRTGVVVHKAPYTFTFGGKNYTEGSYIIKANQAFRPHIIDLFEPQDHPNDFQYPGGPPIPPYDAAGWTLAYTMGVKFDRIMDNIEAPLTRIPDGEVQPLQGKSVAKAGKGGFILSAANNHSFIAVNELLKMGADVYRMTGERKDAPAGSFFVPAKPNTNEWLMKNASALGADLIATDIKSTDNGMTKINKSRIALWDTYGGSMASGWMRWIMEQFHFDATVIYASDIDKADLKSKYDVILFVEGAMPPLPNGTASPRAAVGPKPEDTPEEFKKTIGNISTAKSIPAIKAFLEAGGKVLTIGSSTSLAYHLDIPVRNALTEMVNGKERNLPGEKYYIPGSVLKVKVDNNNQATWGMNSYADVYFEASPVFTISPDAQSKGNVKPIAWFDTDKSLRSGWAWGQSYLKDGVAAFSASVGKGTLFAFGPEIAFRAQTHGTFKLIFNQLYE